MKLESFVSRNSLLVLCFLLISAGCNNTVEPIVPSDSPLLQLTEAADSSPALPTQTAAPSQTPTSLPTHTTTPAPTFTATPTKTPFPTPLPTLPPDEAQALVLDLFENNLGCQLPCWWGFIPGVTPWPAARSFLATFASRILGASEQPWLYVEVFLPVPEEISTTPLRHIYNVHHDIIEIIDVYTINIPAYSLARILTTYGQPDEVWLKTFSESRENSLPFAIALFYPERGFVIDYSLEAEVQDDQVRACPQENDSALISIWSPVENLTFAEAVARRAEFGTRPYYPLEEVTEIDVATFYQTFKDSETMACLETPASLWPYPID